MNAILPNAPALARLARKSGVNNHLRAWRGATVGLHTFADWGTGTGRCAKQDKKSAALRKGTHASSMRGVLAQPFHVTVRRDSTLIIVGTGAVAIAIVASKTMDIIASKAFGSKEAGASADGDKGDTAAAADPVTAPKVDSSAQRSTSASATGNSNARDSVFDEVDPAVAAARKKKAAADAAAAAAKAKDEPAKDKDGNPVEPSSPVDEFMGEVYQMWGGDWKKAKATFFAKNFYDGGFEDKMTRREAALILGVRENTAEQRIKESHRRILLLNHPDRGGSPYVAAKINLAKDLLIKGK